MKRLALIFLLCFCFVQAQAKTVTVVVGGVPAAAPAADYQIAKCYVYLSNADASGENTMMAVYNSAGSRIAESGTTAIGTTGFPKWIEHSVSSGPTLTPDNLYYISSTGDGYINYRAESTPTYQMWHNTRGTWPNTPATISPPDGDTEDGSPEIGMYCTNSVGTLLIGNNNTAGFTTTEQGATSTANIYFGNGYTCVTQ